MKNHSRWPNEIWSSRVHWKDNLRERCTRAKGDINKKWSGLSQSGKDDHKVEEKTCKAKGKTHKASQGKGELAQECWQTPQCLTWLDHKRGFHTQEKVSLSAIYIYFSILQFSEKIGYISIMCAR